ncbi:MAG: peroxiredoxin family protein [Dehalococcoidia bacterium]
MVELQHPKAAEIAGPPPPDYNYATLPFRVFLDDARMTFVGGPKPGEPAPDFELESTDGERVRLSALRGRPVVLIFGSVT